MPPNATHVNLQGRPQQGNPGAQMNSLQGLQPALANNPEFMAIVNAARQGRVSEEQLQQVSTTILTHLDSYHARTATEAECCSGLYFCH